MNTKRIVIATGIYPPEVGGPAQYAYELARVWRNDGYHVDIEVFSRFNYLPTGVRHLAYFLKVFIPIFRADRVFVLDTYSTASPAVLASRICGTRAVIRTGGDFLWESYVERTKDMVLLKDFYTTSLSKLSFKEKLILVITRWTLSSVGAIIWSTQWQRDIFMKPYRLEQQRHFIVENYYGSRLEPYEPTQKNFIAATRPLVHKNLPMIQSVFSQTSITSHHAHIDKAGGTHEVFVEKMRHSYAVILVSISDISPNMILEAIRCQKPFIVTRETGLYDRIKDIALFVNPQDQSDVYNKVLWLLDPENYKNQVQKIKQFTFVHDWDEIAKEYMEICNNI